MAGIDAPTVVPAGQSLTLAESEQRAPPDHASCSSPAARRRPPVLRAAPELSAVEEYWHQAKRDVLVSEYYATFEEMRRTLPEYLRTSGPKLDIMKYMGRRSLVLKDF